MPLSGVVLEFNKKLDTQPELVNSDPYGEGWMIKMKIENVNEIESLLAADAYQQQVGA